MASSNPMRHISRRPLPDKHGATVLAQQGNGSNETDSYSLLPAQNYENVPGTNPTIPNGHGEEHPRQRRLSHRSDWWLWELLFMLVSLVSFVAIIVILSVYNGKLLPAWPHDITLNALIAVMSAIMKASMMVAVAACIGQHKWLWFRRPRQLHDFDTFDQASRGPWGSLLLLFRVYLSNVAAVGALVTILGLALDPFMQQVISFPLRNDSSGGSADILRAQSYKEGPNDVVGLGGGVQTGPSVETKAAIYRGLFTADVQPLEPVCSTGNCTFPLFDSLALCSKCLNVTADVKSSNKQGTSHSAPLLGLWMANLTYSLPGDTNIGVTAYYSDDSRSSLSYGPALVSTTNTSATMSADVLGIKNPILSLAVLQFDGVNSDGYEGDYLKSPPVAHACAMYFCVQTYNTTVSGTKTQTNIVSTFYNETDPVSSIESDDRDRLLRRPSDQPLSQAVNPSNADFVIDGQTFQTTRWYLNKTLSGMQLTRDSEVTFGSDEAQTNDKLLALLSSKDVGALIGRISTSFTNRMRQMAANDSNGFSSKISGDALATVPYVRVQWAWLALPALLMAMSVTLLAVTILMTSRSNVPVWKDSSLPVLFHGLGGAAGGSAVNKAFDNLEWASQMRSESKCRRVSLGRNDGDEWKLWDPIRMAH